MKRKKGHYRVMTTVVSMSQWFILQHSSMVSPFIVIVDDKNTAYIYYLQVVFCSRERKWNHWDSVSLELEVLLLI